MESINLWVARLDAHQDCGYLLHKATFINIEQAQTFKENFSNDHYIFNDEYTAHIEMIRVLLKFANNAAKRIPGLVNDFMYFRPMAEYVAQNPEFWNTEPLAIIQPIKIHMENMFFLFNEKLNQISK
jgi:hypothetical protein